MNNENQLLHACFTILNEKTLQLFFVSSKEDGEKYTYAASKEEADSKLKGDSKQITSSEFKKRLEIAQANLDKAQRQVNRMLNISK
jgi:hypothetical protein